MSKGAELSRLPTQNLIQEVYHRFLYDRLLEEDIDLDEFLEELAEEYRIPEKTLRQARSRGHWDMHRERVRDVKILHDMGAPETEALALEISNTTPERLTGSLVALTLAYSQAVLPIVRAELLARLTTMSNKDVLAFAKFLQDSADGAVNTLIEANKKPEGGAHTGTSKDGQAAKDEEYALALGIRTATIDILENRNKENVIDAEFHEERETLSVEIEEELGKLSAKLGGKPRSFFDADLEDDDDEEE